MNKVFVITFVLFGSCSLALADVGEPQSEANAIVERVLAHRPTKDFSLKARLFITREQIVPVEILVKNTPDDTRTIYRSKDTQWLIIQPERGEVRFFLQGAGELTGKRRLDAILGSNFSYYDLGSPFLHWSNRKFLGEERSRGRTCYLVEATADDEPYARVTMWIDKEYFGLLRAEAFDENASPVKRFAVTSFKRIGDVWVPRALEIAFVPPGQSLPAQEKSRLEIYDGDYDAKLPAEWFSPGRFGGGSD